MKLLASMRRKIAEHAIKFEDAPTLPVTEHPDHDDQHDFERDMEHLEWLTEAIFGEAGRFAARFPEQAETMFAEKLGEDNDERFVLRAVAIADALDAAMARFWVVRR